MCIRDSHYLLLIPSSDGSHACAAEMVRYREERNYEPVSYTHLDVYKRQMLSLPTRKTSRPIQATSRKISSNSNRKKSLGVRSNHSWMMTCSIFF